MNDSLKQIEEDILHCSRCELRASATKPVPGFGEYSARIVLIGEAPGREEDQLGIPFVGNAGKRLDRLIQLAGLNRNDIYFANVCRCRPPDNRKPKNREIVLCKEFLWRELKLLQPKTVITLGSIPLSLFSSSGITQMHGTSFEYEIKEEEEIVNQNVL
jgi:DNA polymerase